MKYFIIFMGKTKASREREGKEEEDEGMICRKVNDEM